MSRITDTHEAVRHRLESHYRYEKSQYGRKIQNQQSTVGVAEKFPQEDNNNTSDETILGYLTS